MTDPAEEPTRTLTLLEVERFHIHHVLKHCGGNVSETARKLGIYRSSLQRKIRRHKIKI